MEKVILEIDNGIATVIINNPGASNALTRDVLEEIKEAFTKIDEDPSVIVAIITGAGEKAFAAGADISSFLTADQLDAQAMSKLGQAVCDQISHCSVPVIAAVNGFAYGGGMEVALSCDIRLASESAKFGQQEAVWGILPGWGGTQRLPRLVSYSDAMKIILIGEPFNAPEAYRMGLVSAIYPHAEFLDRVYEMARKIAKNGPDNIRYIKKAVTEGASYVTRAGLALENELLGRCFNSEEPKKRVQRFLESKSKKS